MADAAGVGGGVDTGAEVFAGAVGVAQGAVLGIGKGGGFLDEDDVVFEAEVLVDVVFGAEVADDDAGFVGEGDEAFGPDVAVRTLRKTIRRRSSDCSRACLAERRR